MTEEQTKVAEVPEEEEPEPLIVDVTEDMYTGTLHEDLVNKFTCMLCYGIVFKPIRCT